VSGGTNVALNKVASSSSTYRNNSRFAPAKGIDGDSTTFFHTNAGVGEWFQVDLNGAFSLESLEFVNRGCTTDPACACHLTGANVLLYDGADNIVSTMQLGDTCAQSTITEIINQCSTPANSPKDNQLACLPNSRKVKLWQSTTGAQIQLFELRAFSSSGNVAHGKSASQSSTYGEQFSASNAVDGNTNTFSHTKDSNSWLEVDLGANFDISSINIINCCCQSVNDPLNCLCRLSNATLSLMDDSDKVIASKTIGDTCGQFTLEYVFEAAPEFCQISVRCYCAYILEP
jgi:hypothetical protein